MGRVNGCQKGKAGEREFAELLRSLGVPARRGQQHAGGADSPDVVADLPGVHFEVKRVEALQLWSAIDQAARDAAPGALPVVVHRPNRRPWIAILPADRLVRLILAANAAAKGPDHVQPLW